MRTRRLLLAVTILALTQVSSAATPETWRPIAFVRDGSLMLSLGPDRSPETLFAARGREPRRRDVGAFAWSRDGETIYFGVALELWRVSLASRKPSRVATLRDPRQRLIGEIVLSPVDHRLLMIRAVAEDPWSGGPGFGDASRFRVDARTGRVSRVSEKDYGRLAGWDADDPESSPRSPSGRWTYKEEPHVDDRLHRVFTPLGIYDAATGERRLLFDPLRSELDRDPETSAWLGRAVVVGWTRTSDTLLVVSCLDCVDTCGGTLYALDPLAERARPVIDSGVSCAFGWNGSLLLVESEHILVLDTATWGLSDFGAGERPAWRPR